MKIRLANLKDAPQISKIMHSLDFLDIDYKHNPSNLKIVRELIRKKHYYVVLEKRKILGAVSLIFRYGSCEIYSLSSIRKGVGRKLIDFAVKKCKENKCPKIWCWSAVSYNAQGFYKKMGFKEKLL